MSFIDDIKEKAKQSKKRIVLPETMDKRVLDAAKIIMDEGIAELILIGEEEKICKLINHEYVLDKVKIINPSTSELTDSFVNDLYELRKHKGLTLEQARDLLIHDYMYFACMLVYNNQADGVVSGACHQTANTLRPALQIMKTKENSKLVSSFFLMIVPDCEYGNHGTFLFADAGLEQNPTSEELAYIARDSAKSFELLTGVKSKTAFLSHSTKGSASHPDVDKVVQAAQFAKDNFLEFEMDGELQLDAAIVPEVARLKAPLSSVAGEANVLIFPDLDAGNIGYKLVQRLAKAEAYGPITQGIRKPMNDLSRGCSVSDIVGVVAITALQASE